MRADLFSKFSFFFGSLYCLFPSSPRPFFPP